MLGFPNNAVNNQRSIKMVAKVVPKNNLTFKSPTKTIATVKTPSKVYEAAAATETERVSYTISYPGAATNPNAKYMAKALNDAFSKIKVTKVK
jgi:hypothetical protein